MGEKKVARILENLELVKDPGQEQAQDPGQDPGQDHDQVIISFYKLNNMRLNV